MDIKIPLIDGYEATKRIREFNKNVLIIAQTAYAFSSDKRAALQSGFDDYISKPIQKEKLFNVLVKYLDF